MSTGSDALLALAERVEAIEGDGVAAMAEAWFAINGPEPANGYNPRGYPAFCPKWESYISARGRFMNFLDQKAFLDAAMTLVPNARGHWPQVIMTTTNPNNPIKQRERVEIWVKGKGKPVRSNAATLALAITAAALRGHAYITCPKEEV